MLQSKPELLFAAAMQNIAVHELAGRACMLLGILGLEGDHRASAIDGESHLVALRYTSGAWVLKVFLYQAAEISLSVFRHFHIFANRVVKNTFLLRSQN